MKSTIETDKVLDLIMAHQVELGARIDQESKSSTAYTALWHEFRLISKLYDDVRRAAQ